MEIRIHFKWPTIKIYHGKNSYKKKNSFKLLQKARLQIKESCLICKGSLPLGRVKYCSDACWLKNK